MKNDKELFEALLAGETLVNRDGDEARFVENGLLNASWDFNFHEDWEIKPKPMEFWVNFYDNGSVYLHSTEAAARSMRESGVNSKTIKVREVTE